MTLWLTTEHVITFLVWRVVKTNAFQQVQSPAALLGRGQDAAALLALSGCPVLLPPLAAPAAAKRQRLLSLPLAAALCCRHSPSCWRCTLP